MTTELKALEAGQLRPTARAVSHGCRCCGLRASTRRGDGTALPAAATGAPVAQVLRVLAAVGSGEAKAPEHGDEVLVLGDDADRVDGGFLRRRQHLGQHGSADASMIHIIVMPLSFVPLRASPSPTLPCSSP